jgi:Domain of unknown function (DUF4189)
MKLAMITAAVILIGSARAAIADSRSDCASQCPVCGGDAVCAQIYDNCLNNCLRGPSKPSPPPLPDVFGAIAVSASTLSYGTSWNYKSKQDADARALQECEKSTSAKDCKIVVTVADVCVALATSKPERVFGVGGPIGASNYAAGNATLKCQRAGGKSCVVNTQFCADGIKHETALPSSKPAPFGRVK